MQEPRTNLSQIQSPQNNIRFFLLVFGLFLLSTGLLLWYTGSTNKQKTQKAIAEQQINSVIIYMDKIQDQLETWSQSLAGELIPLSKNSISNWRPIKLQEHWPAARVVLSSDKNEFLRFKRTVSSRDEDEAETLFEQLKAQQGLANFLSGSSPKNRDTILVWLANHLYIVAKADVSNGFIRRIFIFTPIGNKQFKQIKQHAKIDLAILSPEDIPKLATLLKGKDDFQQEGILSGAALANYFTPGHRSSLQHALPSKQTYYCSLVPFSTLKEQSDGAFLLISKPLSHNIIFFTLLAALLGGGVVACTVSLLAPHQQIPERNAFPLATGAKVITSFGKTLLENSLGPYSRSQKLQQALARQKQYATLTQYQRFFDNAPQGIFRCSQDGNLLQVNQTFAAMLGFDSAVHILTARTNFASLCPDDLDLYELLHKLKEEPSIRHRITFKQRNNSKRSFWIISIAMCDPDSLLPIEGFLLDRSVEEKLNTCLERFHNSNYERSCMALLLASASKQVLNHLLPSPQAERQIADEDLQKNRTGKTTNDLVQLIPERRSGTATTKAVFNDLYLIAMLEAESPQLFSAPLNVRQLFSEVKSQLSPLIQNFKLRFQSAIAEHTPIELSSISFLLRHTLFRALLFVMQQDQNGCLSLSAAPPSQEALERNLAIVFIASWEMDRSLPKESETPEEATFKQESSFEAERQQDSASEEAKTEEKISDQNMSDSYGYSVIEFLANKLNGTLHYTMHDSASRALQLSLPAAMSLKISDEKQEGRPFEKQAEEGLAAQFGIVAESAEPLWNTADPLEADNVTLTNEKFAPLDLLVNDSSAPTENDFFPSQSSTTHSLRILLIEDNPHARLQFSLYLRGTPYQLTEATDSQEALDYFKKKQFDAVFIDMETPSLNSFQTSRILRALAEENKQIHLPIIALASQILPDFKIQCLEAGCTDFLSKPYSRHSILAMLDAVQHTSQREKEIE